MHTYFYATGNFDRSAQRREDHGWLRTRLADSSSRLYPVWRLRHLMPRDGFPVPGTLAPGTLVPGTPAPDIPANDVPVEWRLDPAVQADLITKAATVILLGVEDDVAHFALDLSGLDEHAASMLGDFQELRSIGPLLPQRDGALLAYARGLAYWHQRHRHCGVCGAPTEAKAAGHQRQCTDRACATMQFPRTDPAVIMRITCGNRILMARQGMWARGMYSVLAGFVEPGENLEDAVAREVFEEVGLRIRDIRYFGSQPWPFPASLMLGFTAEAEDEHFNLRDGEIESARWMTRMELLNSPENETFRLPRADSISRRLIENWVKL